MSEVYVIRYEDCPSNPRFRVNKKRSIRVRGNEAQAKAYAESLARGQGVKVLSVKRSLAGKRRLRPKHPPILRSVGSGRAETEQRGVEPKNGDALRIGTPTSFPATQIDGLVLSVKLEEKA